MTITRFAFPTAIHFGAGARKLAGPHLLRAVGDEPASLDAIGARIRDAVAAAATEASDADAPGGLFLAACRRAEAHLLTWVDQLPFGRPLA